MNRYRTPTAISVLADDRQQHAVIDVERWSELAAAALAAEGVEAGEAGLSFVAQDEMASLNEQHMGAPGPTDVLAFPIDDVAPGGAAISSGGVPRLVGDIVICPEVAERSVGPSHSLDDELALLVVHAVLHLLGHDHAEAGEAARMNARQAALLDALYRTTP